MKADIVVDKVYPHPVQRVWAALTSAEALAAWLMPTDFAPEVGRAFTEVQHTAVRSAVDEAELRKGLNEVFLNIARRSQTLLHRQLALLDKMERRETEPDELEDQQRVYRQTFQFAGPQVVEAFLQSVGRVPPPHEPGCWRLG